MHDETTVFACSRGKKPETVKVKLDIPEEVFAFYFNTSQGTPMTPKETMEAALIGCVDRVKDMEKPYAPV